ncbi:hypothetical protein Hanom_Chr07g00631101 [Helianthus anomalus]
MKETISSDDGGGYDQGFARTLELINTATIDYDEKGNSNLVIQNCSMPLSRISAGLVPPFVLSTRADLAENQQCAAVDGGCVTTGRWLLEKHRNYIKKTIMI